MTAMQDSVSSSGQNLWLAFAMISVFCWGLYGILLHSGQLAMGDPANGRMKAFLWVGIAYLLVAVIGPAVMLLLNGANWSMPGQGVLWSLVAGAAGAAGAFGVLLAFGAKGHPAVVMSIIFAGAPMVNALVSLWLHPVSYTHLTKIVVSSARRRNRNSRSELPNICRAINPALTLIVSCFHEP